MSQPVQQQAHLIGQRTPREQQVLEMKHEFARMAERSGNLLRELTAVRRRMDELAACIGDRNLLPEGPVQFAPWTTETESPVKSRAAKARRA